MLSYIFSHTAANLSDGSGSMSWLPNQVRPALPHGIRFPANDLRLGLSHSL